MTNPVTYWAPRICFLVLLALGVSSCGEGPGLSFEEHMARAQDARSEGQLRTAVLEFKNALTLNPDSASARFLLGAVYIDLEDGAAAEAELERAKNLGMESQALLVLISRSWLLQTEFQKVLDEVRISPGHSPNTKAALHAVRGDAYFGLANIDQAVAEYSAALENQPKEVLGHIGLGNVALRYGRLDEARQHLDRATEADASHVRVLILEGDILTAEGKYAEAAKKYKRLVEERPGNVLYRTVLAWSQVNNGDDEAAIRNVDRVLSLVPDYPPANHIKAVLALGRKQFSDARDHASKALAADSGRLSTLLVLGAASHALGNEEQAYQALRRYVDGMPGDPTGRKLLSEVQIALGRSDEALETLGPLLDGAGDDDTQLFEMVAQASLLQGDLSTGRAFLERSLKSAPDQGHTRTTLGRTRIALGDIQGGLEDLEKAVELAPEDFGRRLILALEYLRTDNADKAIATAHAMQELNPDRAAGYTIEGVALGMQGDRAGAISSFEKAIDVEPGNSNASINLIRFAASDEDWDRVRKLLDGILDRDPTHRQTLLSYAELMKRKGDNRAARQYLERAVNAHPEAREPSILLARSYFDDGDYARGLEVARKIQPIHPSDPALLELVGNLETASGQLDSAIITFGSLVEARPDSALAQYRYGAALERQGNLVEAARAFRRAVALEPGYPAARHALTRVQRVQGEFAAAQDGLTDLARDYPDDADVQEDLGIVAAARGDFEVAITALERAVTLRENSVNVRRLGEAYLRDGDFSAAEGLIGTWLETHPDDSETRFFLAGLYLQRDDLQSAEQQYRTLMEVEADNPAVLNNLAYIMGETDRVGEGISLIEKAVSFAPDNVDLLDTAGRLYLKADRPRDAISSLRRANDLVPRQPELQRSYVEALLADGRKDEAGSVLQDLLNSADSLNDRQDLEALYLELTSE